VTVPSPGTDVRRLLVARASTAPSPLNVQPWMVRFPAPGRIDLFIDPDRILPALDPYFRQILIAHGAFLENMDIAAHGQGFRTDITVFPAGWPGVRLDLTDPVARIDLVEDTTVENDPLGAALSLRCTSRRPYRDTGISTGTLTQLSDAYDQCFIPMGLLSDPGSRSVIAGFLERATVIELAGKERFRELLSFLAVTHQEHRRDGYGLSHMGLSPLSRFGVRLRMALLTEEGRSAFLKETLIRLARQQAATAAAYGWITTTGNLPVEQLSAGRAFERVALTAASLGLSLQPMNQILSDCPGMEDLRHEFSGFLGIRETRTIQMFFRLGYAAHVPHTPRQPVGAVIR
jgi:hypothetical protein